MPYTRLTFSDQNICVQISDTVTAGLLINPRLTASSNLLRYLISPIAIHSVQNWFWPDTLQVHRSTSNKMDLSPDIDPTEILEF